MSFLEVLVSIVSIFGAGALGFLFGWIEKEYKNNRETKS